MTSARALRGPPGGPASPAPGPLPGPGSPGRLPAVVPRAQQLRRGRRARRAWRAPAGPRPRPGPSRLTACHPGSEEWSLYPFGPSVGFVRAVFFAGSPVTPQVPPACFGAPVAARGPFCESARKELLVLPTAWEFPRVWGDRA